MNIVYKKADQSDKKEIFNMFCEMVASYENLEKRNFNAIKNFELEKLDSLIEEYDCFYFNNEKVGYVLFSEDGNKMEIDDFYILPKFRNLGIGSEVLKHLISKTEKSIFLYTFIKNIGAIRFYQKFGFKLKEKVDETRVILERE